VRPAAAYFSGHAAWRPPFQTPPVPAVHSGLIAEWAVAGLVVLAIVLIGTVPLTLLSYWKINYVSSGGGFYEKFHPATYVAVAAFLLLLVRRADPIGEVDRMFTDAKLTLIYLFSVALVFVQALVLERPATAAVDTFVLPLLLCLVVWQLAPQQRRPLVWAVHAVVLLNVALGYFEYLSGHRLIPLTVGDVLVTGDWRSTALLGHPLSASAFIAGYTLTLILRPSLCPWAVLRYALILCCLGSLTMFGGRTALSMVLAVIAIVTAREMLRFLTGARASLLGVIVAVGAIAIVCAAALALIEAGAIDKMINRFSSDNGSALARVATLRLLTYFDWRELLLGPDPAHAASLQRMAGLRLGIENFWIACIVQYGIVHTALLTIGLICFFIEVLKRSLPAARVLVLFVVITAASSVSFSSKNTNLAEFIVLIVVLLPRERIAVPQARQSVIAKARASGGLRNGTRQCVSMSTTPTLGAR
jgi:hypothetical protein